VVQQKERRQFTVQTQTVAPIIREMLSSSEDVTKQSQPQSGGLCALGIIQQRVHQTPIEDVDELKQRLASVGAGLQQYVVVRPIDTRRRRFGVMDDVSNVLLQ